MNDRGLTIKELQERFDQRYGPSKGKPPSKGPQLPNLPVKKASGSKKGKASSKASRMT
jgi:hypothetical protein